MIETSQIEQIAGRIVQEFQPKRIILFGSHARGQAGPDSDLDLFIEMETPHRPPERAIAVSSIFGLHPWPMDLLIYTPEEVGRLRGVSGTLLSVIEREGRVLYERS